MLGEVACPAWDFRDVFLCSSCWSASEHCEARTGFGFCGLRTQSRGLSQPSSCFSVWGWMLEAEAVPPHLSRPQIVMEQAGTMPGLATALRGRSRELGSRGALSLTPPVASCAGPSVPGGVGSVKGMWVALAMRPQRPWRGLREGQRGRQAPTFSKDAQGLPAGWEHMGEARAVGTQSPPRCCVRFRPASAPLATGSGEGWGGEAGEGGLRAEGVEARARLSRCWISWAGSRWPAPSSS